MPAKPLTLRTIGPASVNGANAVLTQTTDTTGANPLANYAVFTNVERKFRDLDFEHSERWWHCRIPNRGHFGRLRARRSMTSGKMPR